MPPAKLRPVVGGGFGGLAAALALATIGVRVTLLEQAPTLGELGAGIQSGPNAFNALDYLGVGANARARAVYIDKLVTMDAVCLREAVRLAGFDFARAFSLYQAARITRTAGVQLAVREMGRIYHASGVTRLVRNSLREGRTPEKFYDALDWLYGWTAQHGLDAALADAAAVDRRSTP